MRSQVNGNTHHASTRERGKVGILELLGHEPRDQITSLACTSAETVEHGTAADVAFQSDLDDAERFGQAALAAFEWCQEDKESVTGCVAHELQIVG